MTYRCHLQNGVFYCRHRSGEGQLPVNTAPVATNASYTVAEDTLTVAAPGLIALCTDYELNPMTAYVVDNPSQGNVTVNTDGSFTYQRAINSAYVTYFTYRVLDSVGLYSNTATISLTVSAIVAPVVPPVATAGAYTVAASQSYTAAAPGVLTGDYGEGTLTAYKVTDPSHGTVSISTNGSFTYTPTPGYTGTDTFTYRAYNGTLYSSPATITMTVVAVNATTIDAAWIATHTAPYSLTGSNRTYTLETDVTTDDTAFIIGAAGITLDLNGHTVTYNNRTPLAVPNGLWDQGAVGAAPPNWDLSHAPSAVVRANTNYMCGVTQVLRFENCSSEEYIESDPIALTHFPHAVTAMAWVKGPSSADVTTKIINSDTGAVLATEPGNTGFGYACLGEHPPTINVTTPINVKIRITVTPDTTSTFTVGMVHIAYRNDYGIAASPSTWYYPTQLSTAAAAGQYLTVKNGTLAQGAGAGYKAHAINFRSNLHLNVDNMTITNNGVDSDCINGKDSYYVSVTNSTFNASGIKNGTNRQISATCVQLSGSTYTITGNTFTGYPRMGIYCSGGNNYTIQNNTFTPDSLITEGYGIALSGAQTVDVSYNTITTATSGRGIFLDGLSSDGRASIGVNIHHNTVDIRELPNAEFGQAGLEATALRVRNYVNKYHQNIAIYDNSFTARTAINEVYGAVGMRLTETVNTDGLPIGLSFTNNLFRAIVETTDANYFAVACEIATVAAGTGYTFTGNTFESNHRSLAFGGVDGGVSSGGTFTSNTISKSSLGATRTYVPIRGSWYIYGPVSTLLIDNKYIGGATDTITWEGTATVGLTSQWYLTVYAYNSGTLLPLSGVAVSLTDKDSAVVLTGTTDANGLVSNSVVTGKIISGTAPTPTTNTRTPHTLSLTKTGYTPYSEAVSFTTSKTINVAMVAV